MNKASIVFLNGVKVSRREDDSNLVGGNLPVHRFKLNNRYRKFKFFNGKVKTSSFWKSSSSSSSSSSSTTRIGITIPPSHSNAEDNSSDLAPQCQMMSDHNSSDLAPQCQMVSAENNTSGPASFFMAMTSDHNRSELGIQDHSNEPSSSKLVPKVVPLAVKTATSRQELELLFHHQIAMLRTTEHPSDTNVFTMKMEILLEPASNKLLVGDLRDSI
ncbi:hypothetical protein Tco_0213565 [Tanacetum coccineum]